MHQCRPLLLICLLSAATFTSACGSSSGKGGQDGGGGNGGSGGQSAGGTGGASAGSGGTNAAAGSGGTTATAGTGGTTAPDDGGADAAAGSSTDGGADVTADDDAHADATGGADAAIDGVTSCNALADIGQPVARTANAADPPVMTGGTILDGTYVLTADVNYKMATAPAADATSATLQISGATWQLVLTDHTKSQTARQTFTIQTSGNTFTSTSTCGPFGSGSDQYTATATTLSWVDTTKFEMTTFTKQ